ncbi:transcriptional adapter 3-like [Musca vetustissima]|uniref:transcriptional adapter 3-like n=1 Tax=Musca vetustissima TaxID=27455 RepID=UPI002AB70BC4|nr:transcriptional adapter 3-like [Musca vetustissima]
MAKSMKSMKLPMGQQTNPPVSPDTESSSGLVIPMIKTKDCPKQLPIYSAALGKPAEDYLAAEDLDNIQLELEKLLSSVALRYRVLKLEYENLDKDDKNKDKKSKHSLQLLGAQAGEKQPTSPATAMTSSGKRKRDETSLVRKPKHTTLKHAKNLHNKNSPLAAQQTDDSMDCAPGVHGGATSRDVQKPIPAKIDTPNKFWLSVEPYCMPLTNEDLRLLDDLMEQYNGPLVPPIPELGPHYSTIWAAEDMKEIQQGSNPNTNNRLKPQNNGGVNNMLKKADSIVDECVTGPLTQRLVSALMEEQLITNPADVVADNSNSSSENTHSSAAMSFRSLSMLRNCIGIEKRVKKELIEQGILDISDFPNNDEDEIHAEIKRLVAELSAIAEYNSNALKRLHEAASEEIKRLEVKRKLDAIDQEILETYKRTLQTKAKRKPLSPEEQQEIYRLTAEQKTLSDQLERMQSQHPFPME